VKGDSVLNCMQPGPCAVSHPCASCVPGCCCGQLGQEQRQQIDFARDWRRPSVARGPGGPGQQGSGPEGACNGMGWEKVTSPGGEEEALLRIRDGCVWSFGGGLHKNE
jgi:hypothetical protein